MSPTTDVAPGTDATSMEGRVCMVTGATGGMGRAIATELARRGATTVVVARTAEGGAATARDIAAATGNPCVEVLAADLSDQSAVRALADAFTSRHDALHVLVNNAGAHFPRRALSVDGLEMHLAVDHLAGFLLTRLLRDALVAGAPSRVVDVSSQAIADTRQVKLRRTARPARLDLQNLNSERGYEPMDVYARAKLTNLLCGRAMARRLAGTGVSVNAVHPGLVSTSIVAAVAPPVARPFLGLVRRLLLTPEQGAQAALNLATAPELAGVSGRYFVRLEQARAPLGSDDTELQERAWKASSRLVGLAP